MDRLLVTGGTTFSGLHLVRSLVREGHAVRVMTKSVARARALLPGETEIVVGEITERADVVRAMEGREVVYHLADSAATGRLTSAHDHWRINVLGTRHVLQAAVDAEVRRVVHGGTARVHGDTGRGVANEESAFHPTNAFELTKLQGERLAQLFVRECGLPVAIARPTWTYGADDRRFRRMMASVRRGHIVIPGTRRALVHPIHVEDLVRGLKLLATNDAAVGEPFILGGPEHLPLDELITILARAIGVRRPKVHLPELSTRTLNVGIREAVLHGLTSWTSRVLHEKPRLRHWKGRARARLHSECDCIRGSGSHGLVGGTGPTRRTREAPAASQHPGRREGAARGALETQARRLGITVFVISAVDASSRAANA